MITCEAPVARGMRTMSRSLAPQATAAGTRDQADASFVLTTSIAGGVENNNATTDSRVVCDAAGNCTTAGPIAGNQIRS